MASNSNYSPLVNLLVPQSGGTHTYTASIVASNTPQTLDWAQISQAYQTPFVPQGVYVDASQSTADVVLVIKPLGLSIRCQAGTIQAFSYPAPRHNQKVDVTGSGQVVLSFVDYPVFPSTLYSPATLTQSVSVSNTPLPVSVPSTSGGSPYRTMEAGQNIAGSWTGSLTAATNTAVVPPIGAVSASIKNGGNSTVFVQLDAAFGSVPAFNIVNAGVEVLGPNGQTSLLALNGATSVNMISSAAPYMIINFH